MYLEKIKSDLGNQYNFFEYNRNEYFITLENLSKLINTNGKFKNEEIQIM